ncbi:MAG: cation:proton antiporter [Thermodesulfobacteriota bacterium]
MSHTPMLRDLVVLLAATLPIVFLLQKLRVSSIVGFLVAGVVLGPHGLAAVQSAEVVERLAELGIVLLLFVTGVELSLGTVARLGGRLLAAGVAQVVVMGGLVVALARAAGLDWSVATVLGFIAVHSSTVVALKIFSERGQIDAPQGRVATGILVFQDLCMVPMMLLIPVLATPDGVVPSAVLLVLGKALLVLVVIFAAARFVLPVVLEQVAKLRIREVFTVTVMLFALGTAWLAEQLGLSLAIGALLAGLVLSSSQYSHQVIAETVPFRDMFSSLFFISIGMLLRVDFLAEHAGGLLLGTVGVMALKGVVVTAVVVPLMKSFRMALVIGACLAQVGELAFVLARAALEAGLLSPTMYETCVATAVLSFIVSPFLVEPAERLGFRLQNLRAPAAPRVPEPGAKRDDFVLVIGYGLNGRNLTRVLRETGIKYRILEFNAHSVAAATAAGEPISFGDGTRPDVLHAVGAEHARIIVIAISDPASTRRMTALARGMNPRAAILVRTRYVAQIDELYRLGATEVIPEEFETSVEIFARVLRLLHLPRNVIQLQVEMIRGERYGMLRGLALPGETMRDVEGLLAATLTETLLLEPTSPAVGRSILDLRLRSETGVSIIAVVRGGQPQVNPDPALVLQAGDVLVLLGSHAELELGLARLSGMGMEDKAAS